MSAKRSLATHRRKGARSRPKRSRSAFWIGLAALAILLIGARFYLVAGQSPTEATLEFGPEDVVYDQPLHAVHEMEPPNPASIPFLPEEQPQPRIAVSETFHNFGSLGPTDVVQYDFAIMNTGSAPLTISRAYTTCGCTTADFTSAVIPPGKVSIVTLTFDAGFHDVRGETVRRGVIIENNDRRNPEIQLWTQAHVRSN